MHVIIVVSILQIIIVSIINVKNIALFYIIISSIQLEYTINEQVYN